MGVEKLRVNEEIYKNMFPAMEENDRDVVPLEEALLLNDPSRRRELIMNVLNDNPGEYVELLKQARMNEDVEVVHYAITAMVELSKEYDYRLQKIEKKYTNDPDDPVILEEYCDFLKEISESGLYGEADGTDLQKPVYPAFVKTAGTKGESPYLCLPDGKSYGAKRFFLAEKILKIMDQNWHRGEEYWIWENSVSGRTENGERTETELTGIEGRAYLSFFQRKGGTGILAGWIKKSESFSI
ncbi:MAG: hypothetical protein ACLURP_01140 [Ruminococcus sp.]